FGGGCFWCTEVIFQQLEGVSDIKPGYMGGQRENPTYEQVCTGATGHAEVIHIAYDENTISYESLLGVFFRTHDPTTINRQGNDIGSQYRSMIFYHDEDQRVAAVDYVKRLEEARVYDSPIVTEISPASTFYVAEDYHCNYFNSHPENPYCAAVIAPKLQSFLASQGAR